tara:strand:+ start:323 stop:847 length:525 start_codon:yes stop_codon:yes gene_type:complete
MDPEIWGPPAWIFLHTITLTYPHNPTTEDKKNYKLFFYNLANVLPCSHCSKNYLIHLKQLPIDSFLQNKKSLVYWLVQIHNLTNNNLKKNVTFNMIDFTEKYRNIYNKTNCIEHTEDNTNDNTKNNTNNISYKIITIIILLGLIIAILLFIFHKNIKVKIYNFINSINNKPTIT